MIWKWESNFNCDWNQSLKSFVILVIRYPLLILRNVRNGKTTVLTHFPTRFESKPKKQDRE